MTDSIDFLCNYNIYNGHPGLITKYPELKGKDPQQRAWDNIDNYNEVGSVVHRVVQEVDAGEVICEEVIPTRYIGSLDATYDALRTTSFTAWYRFLKEHLYNHEEYRWLPQYTHHNLDKNYNYY